MYNTTFLLRNTSGLFKWDRNTYLFMILEKQTMPTTLTFYRSYFEIRIVFNSDNQQKVHLYFLMGYNSLCVFLIYFLTTYWICMFLKLLHLNKCICYFLAEGSLIPTILSKYFFLLFLKNKKTNKKKTPQKTNTLIWV